MELLMLVIGFVLGSFFPQPTIIKKGWAWGWGNLKKVVIREEEVKTDSTSNTA